MGIGHNIKRELERQGKSVAWLARKTEIPATTLRSAISRDSDNISEDKVYRISSALNVTMKDLTDGKMSYLELINMEDKANPWTFFLFMLDTYNLQYKRLPVGDDKDGVTHYAHIIYGDKEPIVMSEREFEELQRGMIKAASLFMLNTLGISKDHVRKEAERPIEENDG